MLRADLRRPAGVALEHPFGHLQLRARSGAAATILRALGQVVVTQGFIASDNEGNTVLLGRGGSDTSGAYFAAKLQAQRLEIWTDVPGMFSANPRSIPTRSTAEGAALR